MDKRAGPVAEISLERGEISLERGEISLERGEISLTGMGISPYKHSQAGWPGCRDESSKIPPHAIFNNCQIKSNVKTIKLSRKAG